MPARTRTVGSETSSRTAGGTVQSDQDNDQPRLEKLDIADAAARLGLSIDAVRKRVQRGSLRADKVDNRWFVVLPMPNGPQRGQEVDRNNARPIIAGVQDTVMTGDTNVQDTGVTTPRIVQDVSGQALAVLSAAFTSALESERHRSSTAEQAAAMWQERARNLEAVNDRLQELLALPAHEEEPESLRRPWWRRLLGRSEG